jgi:hypothetical protein
MALCDRGAKMNEPTKTKGQVFEGIAFQFCKIATVALIAGRFALPIAAGACSIFYVLAMLNGKNDTRCFLRYPALIAFLWALVCIVSLAFIFNPTLAPWRA